MKVDNQPSLLKTPKFQVLATWMWNMIAVLLISIILTAALPEITVLDAEALRADPRLVLILVFTEILAVGLLPVLFTLLNRDGLAVYGLQRQGLWKSLAYAALVVLVFFAVLSILAGKVTTSIYLPALKISTLWKPLTAILALLAYGPLEVFFVVWLIHNTDRLYNSSAKLFSAGLFVTVVLYGVLHWFSQGVYALILAAVFLLLGLIYKSTRNAIGPMLAWTLMNDFIWALVAILLAQ
jgi:hypothetical protein